MLLATLAAALAAQQSDPPVAPAAPTVVDRLVVLEKAGAVASLFDPATRKEVARIAVGTGPHECAVSPDGRLLVVCNYGDQKPGDSLTLIDIPTATAIGTMPLRREATADGETRTTAFLRPHGIRFVDDRRVVVTSESARCLLVVDVRDRRIESALPTPQRLLHMVALAPDHRRAFGASITDGTLAIFALGDDAGGAPPTVVATGAGAEGIAARPGHNEVWVANRAADTLSIVDADRAEVAAELSTAAFPIRVAFTPDGAHALVSCAEAGEVLVFDATTRKLAHTIELLGDKTESSPLPIGICVDPDGRTAFVACARGEWLAVVDLATWRVVDRVPAGPGPDGMAWARHRAPAGPADAK